MKPGVSLGLRVPKYPKFARLRAGDFVERNGLLCRVADIEEYAVPHQRCTALELIIVPVRTRDIPANVRNADRSAFDLTADYLVWCALGGRSYPHPESDTLMIAGRVLIPSDLVRWLSIELRRRLAIGQHRATTKKIQRLARPRKRAKGKQA